MRPNKRKKKPKDAGKERNGNSGSQSNAQGTNPDLARLGAQLGIKADSKAGANVLENRNTTVREFIAKNRRASILRRFPSEYLDKTVEQAIRQGGTDVKKLLLDSRFSK